MGRFAMALGGVLLALTLAGCGSGNGGRGEAIIPDELSADEEKVHEAELKAIRAEERKQPKDPNDADKDEP